MSEDTDLILVNLAECDRMLQSVSDMEDALKIKAQAETLQIYAKKVNAGLATENKCTLVRAKIEKRCGEIRNALGKAKGTKGNFDGRDFSGGTKMKPPEKAPTSADLGLTKKTSARMTKLAKVEDADIIAAVTTATQNKEQLSLDKLIDAVAVKKKKTEREKTWKDAIVPANLFIGDFREVGDQIPDDSISLILTDPPYDKKASAMFPELATFAKAKLRSGGSMLCYVGQTQLPAAMKAFEAELRYWWIIACLHSGKSTIMREYGVKADWKPILWFVKKTRHDVTVFLDSTISGGQEKDEHEWQQAESEAASLIEKLCPEDGVVLDPFFGSGTVGVAAQSLNREWIGIEINEETAKKASERLEKRFNA